MEQSPQGNSNQPLKAPKGISRRKFLIGTATAVGAAAAIVGTARFVQKIKENTDAPLSPDDRKDVTQEKLLSPFEKGRKTINEKIAKLETNTTILSAKKARESLGKTALASNGEGVAFYFTHPGEPDDAIALPSVTDMRRHLYDPKYRKYDVVVKKGEKVDRRYSIAISEADKEIGVSGRFDIERISPAAKQNWTVLAVKRARYLQGEKKYGEYVTYTPAHKNLRTKEVITLGKEYVSTVVQEAAKIFTHPGMDKKALALSVEVAKRVAVIEHVDPYEFNKKSQKGEGLAVLYDIAFAEHALNPGFAYNHLINALGAGGMMQIMPKTYRDVRNEIIKRGWFSEQDIPEDITIGRKDPFVSATVSIALSCLNYEFASSNKDIKSIFNQASDEEKLLMLASMYNGSPNLLRKILGGDTVSKVLRPIKNYKKQKKGPKKAESITETLLRNGKGRKLIGVDETENENYIKKFLAYAQVT